MGICSGRQSAVSRRSSETMVITRASFPGIRIGTPMGLSGAFRPSDSVSLPFSLSAPNGGTRISGASLWQGGGASNGIDQVAVLLSPIGQCHDGENGDTLSNMCQPERLLLNANLFWRWKVFRTAPIQSILSAACTHLCDATISALGTYGVRNLSCPPREEYPPI